jgi:glycosyltransferase involved in cell wall biosynthesis
VHHGEALGLLVALQLARIETPVVLTLHVNVAAMAEASRPYRAGDRRLGSWSARDALHHAVVMPVREFMDRAAQAMADRVTFISRSAARDTLGAATAADATVIYNGLPPRVADDAAGVEPCELLYVGTTSVRKRVSSLPLVLAAVRRQVPNATLRIVGFAASENAELTALAESLGLQSAIRFEGRKRSEELGPYYRAAGVLLVPSAYEGLPMVILEAFREGLPCVATRVSGHPEVVVDGVNGRLVPLDDIEAMADAAVEILGRSPDASAALADAARKTVERQFGAERQLREYLALYATLRR